MKRILVCDDDEVSKALLCFRISGEKLGDVMTASDGREAMSLLSSENFDLVITDLHMPFHSGIEIVAYIRERLKKTIPIIILSAEGLESAVLEAFDRGADDYVTKPFNPSELLTKIKTFLK